MRKNLIVTTLILLACTNIINVIPYCVDCNILSNNLSDVKTHSQNLTTIVQIFIVHSSVSDLIIDLGVGDPKKPDWSINIWNKQSSISNLNLTVDVSIAAQYLPPSEKNRWFLSVFDSGSGNQGEIEKFTSIYDNQTYDSMSIPVAIFDFQTSYSYIPGVPLELAISRRISIRDFPQIENYTLPEIPSDLLLKVLWAGYGTSFWGRTTSNICGNYPLIIYVCNKTAVYRYNPDQQILDLFKDGDYRFSEDYYFGYPGPGSHPAPVELFIILNTDKFSNIYLGAMEAGAIVQNIYLEANSLGLGTVCVGGVNAIIVHDMLNLPANEVVLCNMPLGYPASMAFYNFSYTESPGSFELPRDKQSSVFLDASLNMARESNVLSEKPITSQETSQILWAAYGCSYLKDMRLNFGSFQYQHRTIASAGGSYPLKVWMLNSTGTCLYDPWYHDISIKSLGDRRTELAQSAAASWIASSPMILLIVVNTTQIYNGQLDWAYIEIGSLIQNVFLESAAWGLVADWSIIVDENATRTILGIAQYPDLLPIIAITVGHPLAITPSITTTSITITSITTSITTTIITTTTTIQEPLPWNFFFILFIVVIIVLILIVLILIKAYRNDSRMKSSRGLVSESDKRDT